MNALRFIAPTRCASPLDKLVLYELANAHNDNTGKCNITAAGISALTSMPSSQVNAAIARLTRGGTIRNVKGNYQFIGLNDTPVPLPPSWQPSNETLQKLMELFPLHNFDPQEFVHDFRNYTAREGVNIRPADRDGAFLRNATALLETRPSGPAPIVLAGPRNQATSIRSILSAMR